MVNDIEFLAGREEFSRFMDHFRTRVDKLALEILHNDMPPEQREALRQFRLGILEVLGGPQELHRVNAMILERNGG